MSVDMASVFLIPEEHAFLLKQSPNMRVIYGLLSGERLGLPSYEAACVYMQRSCNVATISNIPLAPQPRCERPNGSESRQNARSLGQSSQAIPPLLKTACLYPSSHHSTSGSKTAQSSTPSTAQPPFPHWNYPPHRHTLNPLPRSPVGGTQNPRQSTPSAFSSTQIKGLTLERRYPHRIH
jgi:hypothetical protein